MNPDLPERLSELLRAAPDLAASSSQFAPQLAYGRHRGPAAADARPAAVVLLLFPRQDDWFVPLTLRQPYLADHAGQISLPGGTLEPGESSQAGALRELSEELGVQVSEDQLLGSLTQQYVFHSNFLVTPWLASVSTVPVFQPQADEVAEVIELPLRTLLDPSHQTQAEIRHGSLRYLAPCIRYAQHSIWGATSMILGEFRELVRTALGLPALSPGLGANTDL